MAARRPLPSSAWGGCPPWGGRGPARLLNPVMAVFSPHPPPPSLHPGKRPRVPSRPLLRYLGPPVQIRYPPPHRPPVQRSIRLPFFGTIAPKRTHLVDRGLDPSKAAYLGSRPR